MKAFFINPEDIQVVFLESLSFEEDHFYDLYKELISRGAEPVHISNLTKKYHISNAIHIPINWDSPCFFKSDYSGYEIPKPDCKTPSKTYKLYNDLVNKLATALGNGKIDKNDIQAIKRVYGLS